MSARWAFLASGIFLGAIVLWIFWLLRSREPAAGPAPIPAEKAAEAIRPPGETLRREPAPAGEPREEKAKGGGAPEKKEPGSPASLLTGRVVDPEGEPVASASVILLSLRSGRSARALSAEDGLFELPIREAGPHRISAWALDVGIAAPEPLDLDPAAAAEAPDLVLRGIGTIEGAARHADGKPAAGLEVRAYPERLMGRKGEGLLGEFRLPEDLRGHVGLPCGMTWTDGEGRFRFSGLEPGRYFLIARGSAGSSDGPRDLYLTGEKEAVLIIDK